jgi:hemerythrin
MATLKQLQQQHAMILELMKVLSILLHETSVCDTETVKELYDRMIHQLEDHLNSKDKTISALLTHEDEQIRKTAQGFLGGAKIIHNIFNQYRRQWRTHKDRCNKHEAFLKDTREFFDFMHKHIHDEEERCVALLTAAGLA